MIHFNLYSLILILVAFINTNGIVFGLNLSMVAIVVDIYSIFIFVSNMSDLLICTCLTPKIVLLISISERIIIHTYYK